MTTKIIHTPQLSLLKPIPPTTNRYAIGHMCPKCSNDIWFIAPPSKQRGGNGVRFICWVCKADEKAIYRANNPDKKKRWNDTYRAKAIGDSQ